MPTITISSEIITINFETLAKNATFIHGQDDANRLYFISTEVIIALSWIATNVIIPILTGTAQSTISEKIKNSDKSLIALELEKEKVELEKIKKDIEATLARIESHNKPSEHQKIIATATLTEILELNGWPSIIAKNDASKIVTETSNKLWNKEGK